jgi:iron complex transport system substrate-binding protein
MASRLFAIALFASACSGASAPPPSDGAHRIVTLTPSSTEIVAALGATGELVGVDQFSEHPPAVKELPKVGDFLRPNLDAILALRPTVVVADAVQTQLAPALRDARVTLVAVPIQTIADVRAAYETIGRAIGRGDEGARLAAALGRRLDEISASAAARARAAGGKRRALFVIDRQLGGVGTVYVAGRGTYLDEILALAGAENVMADGPPGYYTIPAEEIIRRAPDVILDAVHTDDAGRAARDWAPLDSVPAVRAGRVHVLADPAVVSPGPRLGEVLDLVARLVWTD